MWLAGRTLAKSALLSKKEKENLLENNNNDNYKNNNTGTNSTKLFSSLRHKFFIFPIKLGQFIVK